MLEEQPPQKQVRKGMQPAPRSPHPKWGQLLYEISDKDTDCCGNTDYTQLQFYEHFLLVRTKHVSCCDCCQEEYYAEAVPRYHIVNVSFTRGASNWLNWLCCCCQEKTRHVTFQVRGAGGGLVEWFLASKYSFPFSHAKPDEDFVIDYVFGPLGKGITPYTHFLTSIRLTLRFLCNWVWEVPWMAKTGFAPKSMWDPPSPQLLPPPW